MIKISILYPNIAGGRFDFDYYLSKHMPRSIELLSAHSGFRGVTVERGLGGTEPGSPPKYIAACFYTFDALESSWRPSCRTPGNCKATCLGTRTFQPRFNSMRS